MRLTCPACGAVMSLDAMLGHEAARSILVHALEQTPAGKRLIRYVALFRPAQRQLSWDRTANLLGELLDMIQAARIERHGRMWAAPQETWIGALDEILARRDEGKLTLPLKSHGYLLEIIAGYANKAEGAGEAKREQERAYVYSRDQKPDAGIKPARAVMPDAVRKQLKQLAKGGAS